MRVEVLGRVATMQVKINGDFAMLETIVVANAESRHLDPQMAHIAYLREPNILTREAFEAAKRAEAVALELLDTEVRWLAFSRHDVNGAQVESVIRFDEGKLTDSIIEDILQL